MRHLGGGFAISQTTTQPTQGAEVAPLNNSLRPRFAAARRRRRCVCVSIFNSAAATGELALLN
jgi:hypothetical protein